MYTCKYCNKEFEKQTSLAGHIAGCIKNPNNLEKCECQFCGQSFLKRRINYHERLCKNNPQATQFSNNMAKICYCRFCNKQCKSDNSLKQHEVRCKENPTRSVLYLNPFKDYQEAHKSWNSGLTKETDERVAKQSLAIKGNKNWQGRKHSLASRQKMHESALKVDHADHNRNSYGKKGYYGGIFFMSQYELAYYIYNRDHGIQLERCKNRFEYIFGGQKALVYT